MKYAEVAVDAPIGYDRTLTYRVPSPLVPAVGQMLWVPLGQRPVQGIVFEVSPQPQVETPRDILSIIEPFPLITPVGLDLARWISRYYLSSLFEAASLMLPPGFKGRVRPYLQAAEVSSDSWRTSDDDARVWQYVVNHGVVPEKEAKESLGPRAEGHINRLIRRGLLQRVWRLPRSRTAPRYDSYLRSAFAEDESEEVMNLLARRSSRQEGLFEALLRASQPMPLSEARKEYGAPSINALLAKGLLVQEWVRREASLELSAGGEREPPVSLTPEQESAVGQVIAALEGHSRSPKTFLLYGVTGSGKTEVYLRALARCIALGRQGILLVPELSLTPQIVHRLNARFLGRVGLIHSGMSPGDQFDYWWRARDGAYDVVVGPRSTLFSPLPKLGLIIIDEEHEWTYKEEERQPRYHVREVALKLAQLCGAVLLMGSATPDVCTYYHATRGRHSLHELPYRVGEELSSSDGSRSGAGLARVEIQDMRRELKEGNRSPVSRTLAKALLDCVNRGEQAILFLNRRGTAALIQCRDCGLVLRCRRCSVALTLHRASGGLLCHHCNRRSKLPIACPSCRSPRIRYLGLGTERVVEEIEGLLPGVTILRWDRDTARNAGAHQAFLDTFSSGEAQILVGTQMIAKGLHVPNVSLVGVILADIGLNLPDFRAVEHTFQLLCQVAGRAGRGEAAGRVIIQTYNPDNYAIQAAARQDYLGLYNKEAEYRRQQGNPPFARLVRMTYLHTNAERCQREALRFGRALRAAVYGRGLTDLDVIGPAPGYPERVRGRFRWHLILRGRDPHSLLAETTIPRGWIVDVDPITVL